jgi:hypothetical protein
METIKFLTFAALAATLLFQTPITRADDQGKKGDDHGQRGGDNERGDRDHRDAQNTFTKWIVDFTPTLPGVIADMAGVVGGDVGGGTFTGEVLSMITVGAVTTIEAVYHFHGSKHSFNARVHVEQTGLNGVIVGIVTDGWLKGQAVEGEYLQINGCANGITGACYQGTLEIEEDSND